MIFWNGLNWSPVLNTVNSRLSILKCTVFYRLGMVHSMYLMPTYKLSFGIFQPIKLVIRTVTCYQR